MLFIIEIFCLFVFALFIFRKFYNQKRTNFPPGTIGLPILGYLLFLEKHPSGLGKLASSLEVSSNEKTLTNILS